MNITNIPAPRVPFIDERTGLMAREWYRFFINIFFITGSGTSDVTTVDLANMVMSAPVRSQDINGPLQSAQLAQKMARFDAILNQIDISSFCRPVKAVTSNQIDPLGFCQPRAVNPPGLFGNGNVFRQKRTGVTINSAATDIATFTNLPSKYKVTSFLIYDASTSLAASPATLGLFTGAGGTGNAVVTDAVLTDLTAASSVLSWTPAITTTYQTSGALYLRNQVAHGSSATVTVQIEILDLS